MGRTTPTFRNMIEIIDSSCKGFSHGLRGREKDAWRMLMDRARKHASAGSYLAMDPPLAMIMCILLEHEMEFSVLQGPPQDGAGSSRLEEFGPKQEENTMEMEKTRNSEQRKEGEKEE